MSRVTLTPRRYETLLAAIRSAYECHDLQTFPAHAMRVVRQVVQADLIAYTELNPRRRRVVSLFDCPTADAEHDVWKAGFERHMSQHPLIHHFERNRGAAPAKISDFLSLSQWHDLALYRDFYRHFETQRQMVVDLPSAPPLLLGIALNRSSRDFTEGDRCALDLLRVHLVQAYHQAELVTELKKDAARAERVFQALDRVWLLLATDGRVLRTSDAAARLFRLYCPEERCPLDRLPETVWLWARTQMTALAQSGPPLAQPQRLVLSRPRGQLMARLVPDVEPERFLLVLEERTIGQSVAALRALGLTAREAEVLFCLAQGHTNPAIGERLHVSPRTVQKHLERVFLKLDVTTRSAAAVKAMECLSG